MFSREKQDLKGYKHPSVHCSPVYNSKNKEATLMSIDRGMNKEEVVYMYNRTLLSC